MSKKKATSRRTPGKPPMPVLPKKEKTQAEIVQEEIDELAAAFIEAIKGRTANVSANALSKAVAMLCLTENVGTDLLDRMAKQHLEATAREMLKKR